MSQGSVYQRKSDQKWCAKYKDPSGNRKYLYRMTKAEARAALRQALADRDAGMVPASKMTVGMLLDQFLEELNDTVSERTWLNRQSLIRNHLKPAIGNTKLSQLSYRDIQRLYKDLTAKGLAPSSIERIHILLNQVLNVAVKRKLLRENPIGDVKPPKVFKKEREILSPEEVKRLLESVRGHRFELVVVLGATCGLRINEALALCWENVDLDKGTINIRHTLWRGEKWNPKTPSSMAVLKLPKTAHDALRRVRLDATGTGWLFPTKTGKPVRPEDFYKQWATILKRAGLPKITYHCLRHGAASYLLNQRVPLPVVSKYLRHSNPAITARLYSHIVYGSEGMAASGIDDALG